MRLHVARSSYSIPVFLVKYEELLHNPYESCSRLLDWLQIERPASHIRRAIEQSSLDNLLKIQSLETRNKQPGIFFNLEQKQSIESGWRFLGDGKSGQYREHLSDTEIQEGLSTFSHLMKQFGYV